MLKGGSSVEVHRDFPPRKGRGRVSRCIKGRKGKGEIAERRAEVARRREGRRALASGEEAEGEREVPRNENGRIYLTRAILSRGKGPP